MRLVKTILIAFISAYLLGALMLFMFQRDFLYFPSAEQSHNFVTERLAVNAESLNIVVLNPNRNDAILYFGGNAEEVVNGASYLAQTLPNHTVYLVNYRGYGGSTGAPTERGLYADALSIYDTYATRHKTISVIGRSLGTGVATYLATNRTIQKLVLVTPYDSILHIAQDSYPFYPISILLMDKYHSLERVEQIICPTLIILAESDVVIPAKYSTRLINAFPPSQIKLHTIEQTGHNNVQQTAEYFSLLEQFFE